MMCDSFASYHPSIQLVYFVVVIGSSMFLMHPVFLAISWMSGVCYSCYLLGARNTLKQLLYSMPLCIVVGIINPLFNHEGITILGYLGDNPLTLESVYYGIGMGVVMINVLIWFRCCSFVMTSDKWAYLFGCKMPTLSLIFSMTLRMIDSFKIQFEKVKIAQQGLGYGFQNQKKYLQFQQGIKLFSIMVTWLIENAIDTSDSMRSRGYGLKGRSSFSIYHFEKSDKSLMGILLILISLIAIGGIRGVMYIRYFPSLKIRPITFQSVGIYIAYSVLCILPVSLQVMEDIRWHYLKSKI